MYLQYGIKVVLECLSGNTWENVVNDSRPILHSNLHDTFSISDSRSSFGCSRAPSEIANPG